MKARSTNVASLRLTGFPERSLGLSNDGDDVAVGPSQAATWQELGRSGTGGPWFLEFVIHISAV